MTSLLEKTLQDNLKLIESELASLHPEKKTDLIKAKFVKFEEWIPPGSEHTDHFTLRIIPHSPGLDDGAIYEIDPSDLKMPWWRLAPE